MKTLTRPSREGRRAELIFQKAVAHMLEENRRLGIPVAIMKNGKAVFVPAAEAIRMTKAALRPRNKCRPRRTSATRRPRA